jgi:hypothetical protein
MDLVIFLASPLVQPSLVAQKIVQEHVESLELHHVEHVELLVLQHVEQHVK